VLYGSFEARLALKYHQHQSNVTFMSENLERIEKALAEINAALKHQSEELQYLREKIQTIAQVTSPKDSPVVIDPECGYEWFGVEIRLSGEIWARVKSGEHIKVKGKGWVPDENIEPDPSNKDFFWDIWEFNGGIGKPMKVTMESPHEFFGDPEDTIAYEGPLLSRFVC
jgi:hypothetical protein